MFFRGNIRTQVIHVEEQRIRVFMEPSGFLVTMDHEPVSAFPLWLNLLAAFVMTTVPKNKEIYQQYQMVEMNTWPKELTVDYFVPDNLVVLSSTGFSHQYGIVYEGNKIARLSAEANTVLSALARIFTPGRTINPEGVTTFSFSIDLPASTDKAIMNFVAPHEDAAEGIAVLQSIVSIADLAIQDTPLRVIYDYESDEYDPSLDPMKEVRKAYGIDGDAPEYLVDSERAALEEKPYMVIPDDYQNLLHHQAEEEARILMSEQHSDDDSSPDPDLDE